MNKPSILTAMTREIFNAKNLSTEFIIKKIYSYFLTE